MKHYGRYLFDAGRSVEYRSKDIEKRMGEKAELQRRMEALDKEISEMEDEFLDFIGDEWSAEEIKDAQQKAYEYNYKTRVKTNRYEYHNIVWATCFFSCSSWVLPKTQRHKTYAICCSKIAICPISS